VKDATGDLSRPAKLAKLAGDDFCQLSGNDDSVGEFMAQGGDGIITVVGNIAPRMNADLIETWERSDIEAFNALIEKLSPLAHDLFCESNPAPVKYAASRLGLCRDEVRLPLVKASAAAQAKVDAAMAHAGLSTSSKVSAA
jgi:4-hydroxy-tetrahydrodipicolinate synthase